MIVYHYTTTDAYNQILRTNNILQSDPLTTMDASYGRGWYFTELPPTQCEAWTVAHCWRSLSEFKKVECYLKFDIPDVLLTKCRDHVYMLNTWSDRIKYIEGNPTPKCAKAPCALCEVIGTIKKFFGWQ